MELGTNVRNWGKEANPQSLTACAQQAEAAGLDAIWLNDHVALTPGLAKNTEGGDWLESLATLAFLASATERIGLGVGVLIAPYRPDVLLAKGIATVQTLSQGRLRLGLGVGWVVPAFESLGIDAKQRGHILERQLAFLNESFASDTHDVNGAQVILRPVPKRPRIYIGGNPGNALPEHSFRRAVQFRAEGWIPSSIPAEELVEPIRELAKRYADAGLGAPEIVAMKTLPLEDPNAAIAQALAFADAGVTHLVHTGPYDGPDGFAKRLEGLAGHVLPALRRATR